MFACEPAAIPWHDHVLFSFCLSGILHGFGTRTAAFCCSALLQHVYEQIVCCDIPSVVRGMAGCCGGLTFDAVPAQSRLFVPVESVA